MTEEEKIKQELESRFSFLKDLVVIKRQRRLFADVPADAFGEVLEYAARKMRFTFLSAITGMDETDKFAVIYHLSRPEGILLNLKIRLSRETPVLRTVTPYFAVADAYERELTDLLGIKVEGLPPGNRYPLPDGWPEGQYPLRKDWKGDAPKASDPEICKT